MRIAITRTQVPFVRGGAERHGQRLCEELQRYGHDATEVTIPFKWYPTQTLVDSITSAKGLDLSEAEGTKIDLMIGLKFPAYLARHPNPVFWILHQHRQAYDMWENGSSDLLDAPDGLAVKQMIAAEDRDAFTRTSAPIYTNSHNVSNRLERHLQLPSQPLYHPPPLANDLRQGAFGERLFAPGRLNPSKRVDLMLQALAVTDNNVQLDIAGQAENPAYFDKLCQLAEKLDVAHRVRWLGAISDEELITHYAACRAVVFVPHDEDYGYVTVEAMLSGKPVITVSDSGGPLEFITDTRNGYITAPMPGALGRAMQALSDDVAQAERLGAAGHEDYTAKDICWSHVIESLTGEKPRLDAAPLPLKAHPMKADITRIAPDAAVDSLREAIRPKSPSRMIFSSVIEVLEAYDLSLDQSGSSDKVTLHDAGLVSYLDTHWRRYLNTMYHIERLAPKTVLNIGTFPPLVFEAMIAATLKDVHIDGIWEGPGHVREVFRSRLDSCPDLSIDIRPANVEQNRLPFPDGSKDLILGMEILEHLALDPHFFLSEANRVLQPGGHILLTTPNICSHRGVWKMMGGESPYSFGVFVPTGGVYGRHNREYTPKELVTIGDASGFETEYLGTADVYDDHIEPGAAALLAHLEDPLLYRGENIIYVGRKTNTPGAAPRHLYHGNPVAMQAELQVRIRDEVTGLTEIIVTNTSPVSWPATGMQTTIIQAEWRDGSNKYRGHVFLPLNKALRSSESEQIDLLLDEAGKPASGTLSLHVYQRDVGKFTGTGRSNTVNLPCSQEAFERLMSRYEAS